MSGKFRPLIVPSAPRIGYGEELQRFLQRQFSEVAQAVNSGLDVVLSSAANNDILRYDSTDERWENFANIVYANLPTGGGTWANGGTLSITGGVTTVAGLTSTAAISVTTSAAVTGAAGAVRDYFLHTAGVNRWGLRASSTAEGGADTGSNLQLNAYTDAGTFIDSVIAIARVAAGGITFASGRAVSMAALTATTGTFTGLLKTTVTTQQLSLNYDASNHLAVTVGSAGGVTYAATGLGASHSFANSVNIASVLTVTRTAQQLGLQYDVSNYLAVTVSSAGAVTYDAVGASANHIFSDAVELDGDLNHDGSNVGFYGTAPVALQTGVAVTAAGIHAALVNLGLITA